MYTSSTPTWLHKQLLALALRKVLKDGAHGGRQTAREMRELKVTLGEVNELLDRRDALLREVDSSPKEPGTRNFHERVGKIFEAQRLEELAQGKMFPPDPPNQYCRHAIVGGILFYNTAGVKRGDFKKLFKFGLETAYVWTHTRNACSTLVVEVDDRVHEEKVWKTLGSCLRIAMAFRSSLEYTQPAENFAYNWIYYFDPEKPLEEHTLLESDPLTRDGVGKSGVVEPLYFLKDIAPGLDLLERDNKFFVASHHLIASVESHYFCLACALQQEGHKMHPNHEPKIWEVVETIPKMEVAIVQATRAVEAILGKPGKRGEPKKLARTVERWKGLLSLDPNETFELVGESYLDYYYDMFGTRGKAAHSLGKLPYDMSRQLTIEAQCFAWIILWHYIRHHSLAPQAAAEALRLDQAVYASEPDNTFSIMTDDPE